MFDLIARRLIAGVLTRPGRYQAVRVVTESEGERFVSMGTTVLEEGFRAVYRDIRREQQEEAPLPQLHEGDARTVRGARVKSDKTKPAQGAHPTPRSWPRWSMRAALSRTRPCASR